MGKQNILVTGATGQQGCSVVNALVERGYNVYGLTRNPDSQKAKILSSIGVEIAVGDLNDTNSLKQVFKPVDSLFLMGTPFEAGVHGETQQGINAINVAGESGIKHLVYSSVSDADRHTGVPHFDSKYKVEKYLEESGVPFTIIAPVFFYDNMMAPFILPGLQNGTLAQALPADVLLQSVSLKNIGNFVRFIFDHPDQFFGKRINIAGDNLNGLAYAKAIGSASGKKINYHEVPNRAVRESSEDMAKMYEWFNSVGYSVDIQGLKKTYPGFKWETFSKWANRQDWSILEKYQ